MASSTRPLRLRQTPAGLALREGEACVWQFDIPSGPKLVGLVAAGVVAMCAEPGTKERLLHELEQGGERGARAAMAIFVAVVLRAGG